MGTAGMDHLVVRYEAKPESVTEGRHRVTEYAEELGMQNVDDLALAVTEAVANAVAHAYRLRKGGSIEVMAEVLVPDTLRVTVTDDGDGMTLDPESGGLGLGLSLIGSLSSGVEIKPREPHGTSVRMHFPLETV
jgi:anti-sigma regulatory factor (Ser/Thr protein kinase)